VSAVARRRQAPGQKNAGGESVRAADKREPKRRKGLRQKAWEPAYHLRAGKRGGWPAC